jgi:hypothetical protein
MREAEKKHRQGIMIASVTALVVVTLFGASAYLNWTATLYDEETFCPKDRPYAQSIILVDQTDNLSPIQKRSLGQVLENIRDGLATFERMTIYVLNEENFADSEPVFDLCNPGTGEDANFVYQNPRMLQKKWDDKFGEPLRQALELLLVDRTASTSPILEMIQTVTNLSRLQGDGGSVRLYVVSDLLQNMPPRFTHYDDRTDIEAFLISDYFESVRSPMNSIDVHVHYVIRPNLGHLQDDEHIEFWSAVLQAQGARLVEVIKWSPLISCPAGTTCMSETTFDDVASSVESASNAPASDEEAAIIASIVSQQITERWHVYGSRFDDDMDAAFRIEIWLSRDGHVLRAEVLDVASDFSGEALRGSALRAVNYFIDRPFLNLPLDQYDMWQNMIIRFDPKALP